MSCENGTHEKVVRDRFAEIPSIKRAVPGDCFCLDCGEPLPYWWNHGNPKPVPEAELEASQ